MVEKVQNGLVVKLLDSNIKENKPKQSITNNTDNIVIDFCQNPEDARTKMKDFASEKQKQIAESLIQTCNESLKTDSCGILGSLGVAGCGTIGAILPFIPAKVKIVCLAVALAGLVSTGIFGNKFYNDDRNLMGATNYFRDGQFKLNSNKKKELPTPKSVVKVALALFSKAVNYMSKHSEISTDDKETIDTINALNKNKDVNMIDIWRMIFGSSEQSAYVDKDTIRKEAIKLFGNNGLMLHHVGVTKQLNDFSKNPEGIITFNDIDLSEYDSIERDGGTMNGTTTQHRSYKHEFNDFFQKYLEKGITLEEFELLKKYAEAIGNGQADKLFNWNNKDKQTNQGDLNLLGALITGKVPEKWESNSDTIAFMLQYDFNLDGRVDEEDKKIYEERKKMYPASLLKPGKELSIDDYDLTELYIKAKQLLQQRYSINSSQLQESL